jgi:hypothetical protein
MPSTSCSDTVVDADLREIAAVSVLPGQLTKLDDHTRAFAGGCELFRRPCRGSSPRKHNASSPRGTNSQPCSRELIHIETPTKSVARAPGAKKSDGVRQRCSCSEVSRQSSAGSQPPRARLLANYDWYVRPVGPAGTPCDRVAERETSDRLLQSTRRGEAAACCATAIYSP